jgi:hypothetical protein
MGASNADDSDSIQFSIALAMGYNIVLYECENRDQVACLVLRVGNDFGNGGNEFDLNWFRARR